MAKVIVDVDKDYFEILKYEVQNGNDYLPIKIIANGIPLSEELEKIKAEIKNESGIGFDGEYYIDVPEVNTIIDRYITEIKGENQ